MSIQDHTGKRETPHAYVENPTTPGTCWKCRRADPNSLNRIHKLPDHRQQQDEHRRRAGEK